MEDPELKILKNSFNCFAAFENRRMCQDYWIKRKPFHSKKEQRWTCFSGAVCFRWIVQGIKLMIFLVVVPNRSTKTLIDIIKGNIAKGSIIYTYCGKACKVDELQYAGFEHFTVNHKHNFVDPESGCHNKQWSGCGAALKVEINTIGTQFGSTSILICLKLCGDVYTHTKKNMRSRWKNRPR